MRNVAMAVVVTLVLALVPVAGGGQGKGKPGPPSPPPPSPSADPAIAFIQGGGGRGDLMVMNADGSNFRTLVTQTGAISEFPGWAPDGRHIVFQSDIQGIGVYVADVATGSFCKLVATQTSYTQPAWSPVPLGDGKYKIAYSDVAPLPNGTYLRDIFLVDANVDCAQSTPRNLTRTLTTEAQEIGPSWSPDGTSLITISTFTAGQNCDTGLVVWDGITVDPDGTLNYAMSWQLTGPGSPTPNLCVGSDAHPDWANLTPQQILFAGTTEASGNRDLWVADISNRPAPALTNLTNTSSATEIYPSWSPTDSQITFVVVRLSGNSNGYLSIHKMNADGSGVQVLASDKKLNYLYPDWRSNP